MDLKKQPDIVLEAWPIWDSCKFKVCAFLSRNVGQVFGGLLLIHSGYLYYKNLITLVCSIWNDYTSTTELPDYKM